MLYGLGYAVWSYYGGTISARDLRSTSSILSPESSPPWRFTA
jgi:hypothetical protein